MSQRPCTDLQQTFEVSGMDFTGVCVSEHHQSIHINGHEQQGHGSMESREVAGLLTQIAIRLQMNSGVGYVPTLAAFVLWQHRTAPTAVCCSISYLAPAEHHQLESLRQSHNVSLLWVWLACGSQKNRLSRFFNDSKG